MTTTVPSLPVTTSTWRIDPSTVDVSFAVRKRILLLVRLAVVGRFAGVEGTIELDEDEPANSRVEATIRAATVDTGIARRDKHLRASDFFDVERFPTITFRSRAVTPVDPGAGRYRITGDLTVRDATRTVELDTYVDPQSDALSGRLRFNATARFNRRDFGMNWNSPLIKVYDDVAVTLGFDAVRE